MQKKECWQHEMLGEEKKNPHISVLNFWVFQDECVLPDHTHQSVFNSISYPNTFKVLEEVLIKVLWKWGGGWRVQETDTACQTLSNCAVHRKCYF